jgi:hypothetical protein
MRFSIMVGPPAFYHAGGGTVKLRHPPRRHREATPHCVGCLKDEFFNE